MNETFLLRLTLCVDNRENFISIFIENSVKLAPMYLGKFTLFTISAESESYKYRSLNNTLQFNTKKKAKQIN